MSFPKVIISFAILWTTLLQTGCQVNPAAAYRASPILYDHAAGIIQNNPLDKQKTKRFYDGVSKLHTRTPKVVSWDRDELYVVRAADKKWYLLVIPNFSMPADNAWIAEIDMVCCFWKIQKWITPLRGHTLIALDMPERGNGKGVQIIDRNE